MIRHHPGAKSLLVPADQIEQHPLNPNNGDLDAIEESMDMNGVFAPIGVDQRTGYILDGNHRYVAMLAMGATEVPVYWLQTADDDEALRILIAANSIAKKAKMDEASLLALLRDRADGEEMALIGTGLTHDDIRRMEESISAKPLIDAAGYGEHIPSGITCPECGHSW